MTRFGLAGLIIGLCPFVVPAPAQTTVVPLRTRIQPFHADGSWVEARFDVTLVNAKTAIIVVDMWDKHWCPAETERVRQLALRVEPFLAKARDSGILIIHAPTSTMKFYAGTPGRLLAQNAPRAQPPPNLNLPDVPLPIDQSDGGCDTPAEQHDVWSREIATLSIKPGDVISDNVQEIYDLLKQHQVDTVIYVGDASNMCVLDRPFGIEQMSRWGFRCILVRDMTNAMYNPRMKPYVTYAQANELVIQYIEQNWAPTVTSRQVLEGLSGASADVSRGKR